MGMVEHETARGSDNWGAYEPEKGGRQRSQGEIHAQPTSLRGERTAERTEKEQKKNRSPKNEVRFGKKD